jgi:peptide/nickel transport system substrate-binding protein
VLVVAGGILASLSLLTHFGALGARSGTTAVVRGGTWTQDIFQEPNSLVPNGSWTPFAPMIDNALYLPLFYGDAQGVIHPGAASEVPTLQNGGISADTTTWTFHLRPHLVWSDGQPYDARDVDYTWQLWRNPAFGANNILGLNQKSQDNLTPTVTSGPFLLSEYVPGDHFTLVRNTRYYLASQGLPYLDKVVFHIADIVSQDTILQDLQAGTITSAWFLDPSKVQDYQRLSNYTLVTPPTTGNFEGMYFNFHNVVLATHPEVRQAMAMAIDQQTLIQGALHGQAHHYAPTMARSTIRGMRRMRPARSSIRRRPISCLMTTVG